MPAIRILHISSPLTWRGGEQQVAYLVKELSNKNVEQWIISPFGSKLSEFCAKNNWNIIGYKKSGGIDLALARKIARISKQNKIDIIHCHDAHAHAGAVLSAFVFDHKVPVVLSRRVDFPIGKSWFSR